MKKNDLDQLIRKLENGEYTYKYHGKKMSEGMQASYAQYIKDTTEKVLNQIDDSYDCADTSYMYPNGRDDE